MSDKPCQHTRLRFNSGDYYIACVDCPSRWATISHGRPEYGEDKDGRAIGADPSVANQGFEQHGDHRDIRQQNPNLDAINSIENALGLGRGWGADAYFRHSGGKVSLGQAREVWNTAMSLVKLARSDPKAAA